MACQPTNEPKICGYIPPAGKDVVGEASQGGDQESVQGKVASGYRYGHEDWLVQFKRTGAGIGLLDPQALAQAHAPGNWAASVLVLG